MFSFCIARSQRLPECALLGTPPEECCSNYGVVADGMLLPQVVLPEGMAAESIHSAAGLQMLAGELLVAERTVEQVQLFRPLASHGEVVEAS